MGKKTAIAMVGLTLLAIAAVRAPVHAFENVTFKATEKFKGRTVALRAELFRPKGPGPFPAVVLMHGCGGRTYAVRKAHHVYAQHLVRNGFVALSVDSLGPRGVSGGWVCRNTERISFARFYRSYDIFDAKRFLEALPYVDPDNVFAMGQSNGASVVIEAAKSTGPRIFGRSGRPFAGVAAFYPWCGIFSRGQADLVTPILILAGERDDWTPSAGCRDVQVSGSSLEVVIYPKAVHAFDLQVKLQRNFGYKIGYNRHAAVDGRARMIAFFKKHLTPEYKAKAPLSVKQVQQALTALGYDPGPIDGAFGAQTLSALNRLREKHAHAPVTELDAGSYELIRSLRR